MDGMKLSLMLQYIVLLLYYYTIIAKIWRFTYVVITLLRVPNAHTFIFLRCVVIVSFLFDTISFVSFISFITVRFNWLELKEKPVYQ